MSSLYSDVGCAGRNRFWSSQKNCNPFLISGIIRNPIIDLFRIMVQNHSQAAAFRTNSSTTNMNISVVEEA
ncbi:hypothetical protein LXL04_020874 [Taraxacum kok-saghyz]